MKKKLELGLLTMAIECRWRLVMEYRKNGNKRIERGEALSSETMLRLSRRIDGHSCALARLQEKYARLAA